eukprot:NODE_2370_length_1601_cov_49.550744_g2037_i0.p1 GENE.NODE_2370_length_1601_cov_49.550744_g2037_i0~~NODE_2370_length_1601_cov_49.550744_g2037_i0.p1  ORF type:complete len:491 (+),score=100.98 NODE_2370_length_1601_cov_49.550744_g2037_i0:52-1524(+)
MMNFLYFLALLVIVESAKDFPPGFTFGTATASYQVEGAVKEGGRKPSIWDIFSHNSGKTYKNETGDIADDHYHRYLEDIQLMVKLGIQNYRLSVAWTRIIPDGVGAVNQEGIDFYNDVINNLLENKITPYVTLYHWDLPATLGDVGGWRNETIIAAFSEYSRVCFAAFGDRVKHWMTFNEPLTFIQSGYMFGVWPPQRCSDRTICKEGNSSTEPYLAGHHVILAHGAASKIYRTEFQPQQKGIIGMVNTCGWCEPLTDSDADRAASVRAIEFTCSWWNDPIVHGDYPQSMKEALGDRLPQFTVEEKIMLKGSVDFIGFNHYSSRYAYQPATCPPRPSNSSDNEACVVQTPYSANGTLIGPVAASSWLYVVPWGIRKMANFLWKRHGLPIYVTENGVDENNTDDLGLGRNLNDVWRISFMQQYLYQLSLAIKDGADVRAYFAWSLMDNFEWADAYSKRFGLVYIDFNNNLTRIPKASYDWYREFIANNTGM